MRFDRLQDWLGWLETCHPSEIEMGLGRASTVAKALDINFGQSKIITVAGTNGKGSCVAVLNTLLTQAGYRVGAFTSPHFLDYNERIVVNNQAVKDLEIIESFHRIDQCRQTTSLTYFEFGTLAALDIFCRSNLDVVILEVGLGGRLDVVNIIDADIAIITSIDIDHVDWLGPDRESIGAEKAGVFRPVVPAICADPNPPESILNIAEAMGSRLLLWGKQFDLSVNQSSSKIGSWVGEDLSGNKIDLPSIELPDLPVGSIAAAIQAIELLPLADSDRVKKVNYDHLKDIHLPGRFQKISLDEGLVILDVAHNPAAARHLQNLLSLHPIKGRTYALVAMMSDKDVEGIIEPLQDAFDGWFLGDLVDNPRAKKAFELEGIIKEHTEQVVTRAESISEALDLVLEVMDISDRVVVFGSFFTVAEVMALISKANNKKVERTTLEGSRDE